MPDGTGPREVRQSAFPSATSTSASPKRTRSASPPVWRPAGLRPVCAIYSTFLQRAYDQIVHDVVVQNLPVVFCMDRAGFVGDDGPTHMGLYDIAYLRTLPNITLMAPRNEEELLPMLEHALSLNAPAGIRYPRGSTSGKHDDALAPIVHGKAEVLRRGRGVAILAYGTTVDIALDAYDSVSGRGDRRRRQRALRQAARRSAAARTRARPPHIITLEEHSLAGGFGSAVAEFVSDRGLEAARRAHRRIRTCSFSTTRKTSSAPSSASTRDAIAAHVAAIFDRSAAPRPVGA